MASPLFLTKWLIRTGLARFVPSLRRLADGDVNYLHYYSDRSLSAPAEQLSELAAFQEIHGPDAIDLALGEPRFDFVPSASTKLPADRRGPPPVQGLPELRAEIARGESEDALITPGCAGAFSLAVDTFVNHGDRVVLFDPTSPLYSLMLRQRRARIRWVPTRRENGVIHFHLEPLVRQLKSARLIVVNAPANPTGAIFTPADLEQIVWWAHRHDVLIFNDEAFDRYRYEGDRVSITSFPRAAKRTLTAGSISKSYAQASSRVGWLTGHRHLIRPCTRTAELQASVVPTLSQQIAVSALRQGLETFAPLLADFESRRRYAFGRLQAMGLQPEWPAGAFFLWTPVRELGVTGYEFAEKLLREKKVLVRPGTAFGPSGANHVRLSYAAEDGRLRQGLSRLADFVRELKVKQLATVRQAA